MHEVKNISSAYKYLILLIEHVVLTTQVGVVYIAGTTVLRIVILN